MSVNHATTLDAVQSVTIKAMDNAVTAFSRQLEKLHTGRASPALLENIHVPQPQGGNMLLSHIARISVVDAQTLLVTPWDKLLLSSVQKAILQSELGLNPMMQGDSLRIPLPPLNDKRRQDMVRMIRKLTEDICEEVRSHRRQANNRSKTLLKDKAVSEDECHRTQNKIQKLTDDYIRRMKTIADEKDQQILRG